MAHRAAERENARGPQERAIRLGGGFTYWSSEPPDVSRNTPSRPAYTNGLFLYPFSVRFAPHSCMQPRGRDAPRPWTIWSIESFIHAWID